MADHILPIALEAKGAQRVQVQGRLARGEGLLDSLQDCFKDSCLIKDNQILRKKVIDWIQKRESMILTAPQQKVSPDDEATGTAVKVDSEASAGSVAGVGVVAGLIPMTEDMGPSPSSAAVASSQVPSTGKASKSTGGAAVDSPQNSQKGAKRGRRRRR